MMIRIALVVGFSFISAYFVERIFSISTLGIGWSIFVFVVAVSVAGYFANDRIKSFFTGVLSAFLCLQTSGDILQNSTPLWSGMFTLLFFASVIFIGEIVVNASAHWPRREIELSVSSSGFGQQQPKIEETAIPTKRQPLMGVFFSPKRTFQQLPSKTILWLAVLIAFYFGMSRFLRSDIYTSVEESGSVYHALLAGALVTLTMIPFSAWVMKIIIRVFGKQLSVIKLINIYGYSLIPRGIFAFIVLCALPLKPNMLDPNALGLPTLVLAGGGIVTMLYSLILYVYGIVVSTNEY